MKELIKTKETAIHGELKAYEKFLSRRDPLGSAVNL